MNKSNVMKNCTENDDTKHSDNNIANNNSTNNKAVTVNNNQINSNNQPSNSNNNNDHVALKEFIYLIFGNNSEAEYCLSILTNEMIDMKSLIKLNENDFREMKMKIGPRKKLVEFIEKYKLKQHNKYRGK